MSQVFIWCEVGWKTHDREFTHPSTWLYYLPCTVLLLLCLFICCTCKAFMFALSPGWWTRTLHRHTGWRKWQAVTLYSYSYGSVLLVIPWPWMFLPSTHFWSAFWDPSFSFLVCKKPYLFPCNKWNKNSNLLLTSGSKISRLFRIWA
jgi:hypothetical protein